VVAGLFGGVDELEGAVALASLSALLDIVLALHAAPV
jgi:hypothetical protein